MEADFKVPFAFNEPFEKPPKEKQTKALEEDENQEDLNG